MKTRDHVAKGLKFGYHIQSLLIIKIEKHRIIAKYYPCVLQAGIFDNCYMIFYEL